MVSGITDLPKKVALPSGFVKNLWLIRPKIKNQLFRLIKALFMPGH